MGKRAATVIVIFRTLLSLAIIAGASMVLYGFVNSRAGMEDLTGQKQCLLWAETAPAGVGWVFVKLSSEKNCRFTMTCAIVSIVVAALLSAGFIYQLVQGTSHERTCSVWFEMLLALGGLVLAIVIVVLSSAGVEVFCSNMHEDGVTLPCKEVPLCVLENSCAKTYLWYPDLYIAETGSWFVGGGWLLQLAFSVYNFCLYRKSQRAEEYDVKGTSDKAMMMKSMEEA